MLKNGTFQMGTFVYSILHIVHVGDVGCIRSYYFIVLSIFLNDASYYEIVLHKNIKQCKISLN